MKPSDKTGTLVEHLAELRKRLIIILTVNIIGALICYEYMASLIQLFIGLNPGMNLVYISPSELFMVYVKLALICALIFCFPVSALQIWLFVSKGLLKREQIYVLISFFFGLIFFVAGAVFCYYVVLPVILQFFSRISLEEITPMVSIESYVSFCTTMLLSFGAAFELPVAVFLLSELELLKPAAFRRLHGVFILLIFIVAALITPPDVVSQILLAVPMVGLLELSMGICWFVDRQKQGLRKRSPA
ncbi:MAG: twin-arginine translocase subunit TatC [Hungatella sp.]|nr:twin-arginine translocase subunit TatC [Hungatella sp.]